MARFIILATVEGKPVRVNVEMIQYYRTSAAPRITWDTDGQREVTHEPATAIWFSGMDSRPALMVRQTVEEIDRLISPSVFPRIQAIHPTEA